MEPPVNIKSSTQGLLCPADCLGMFLLIVTKLQEHCPVRFHMSAISVNLHCHSQSGHEVIVHIQIHTPLILGWAFPVSERSS